jgi:hypothetical protein
MRQRSQRCLSTVLRHSTHLLYLLQRQCCWDVLLVCQDEQRGPKQALLLQQRMELLPASSKRTVAQASSSCVHVMCTVSSTTQQHQQRQGSNVIAIMCKIFYVQDAPCKVRRHTGALMHQCYSRQPGVPARSLASAAVTAVPPAAQPCLCNPAAAAKISPQL